MNLQLLAAALIPDKPQNCGTGQSNAYKPEDTPNCITNLPNVAGNHDQVVAGLGIAFGVAAGVALVSLALAAFNYATAATDADKITRAKKTIVLSLIGLVITLSAEAIVLTVLGRL